jgi:phenylpropionate dioxygenase-like ring-hydroxylating dioxygenase large terminal subunit
LAAQATKGIRAPAPRTFGVPQDEPGARADRRTAIPPLGLREYWFPLVPDRRVPRRKPLFWKMLGDELTLFRDASGAVRAISDVCPHRGASMSRGKCLFEGTVACPYHGAVFNGEGECIAFITEGPDSKMVGNLSVRSYPTVTLKGWVFVWMGSEEPAPIRDDIPPEFFEPKSTLVMSSYTYWQTSWIVSIENQNDSHNYGLYVHRNSLTQLMSGRSRNRTPVGTRSKLINDAALFSWHEHDDYYADAQGQIPFQLHYPAVDGKWPKTRARRWLALLFAPWRRFVVNNPYRKKRSGTVVSDMPEEWRTGAHRLPGMVRLNGGYSIYNRWPVPVEPDLSRMVYFNTRRANNPLTRLWWTVWHHAFYNWFMNYNFSGQDDRAASPCRYWTDEYLSPCDSHLILLRRLVTERSRDAKLGRLGTVGGQTLAETRSFELQEAFGREVEDSLAKADDPELIRLPDLGSRRLV